MQYLKKALEIFSLGPQTHLTSNKHIVHCTSKCRSWNWGTTCASTSRLFFRPSVQGLLLHTLSFDLPPEKNRLFGFRSGERNKALLWHANAAVVLLLCVPMIQTHPSVLRFEPSLAVEMSPISRQFRLVLPWLKRVVYVFFCCLEWTCCSKTLNIIVNCFRDRRRCIMKFPSEFSATLLVGTAFNIYIIQKHAMFWWGPNYDWWLMTPTDFISSIR